jgi:3-hydroxymyristoyl/3-hydroxydecanoyl-(acyl carrier protein) dehydratase
MQLFGSYGLDISSDVYIKDVAMIVEAAKSMISRQYHLDHPFHLMVDNIFDFSYNEDSTVAYTYKIPNKDEE